MADIQVGITDAAEAARIINEDRAKTNGDSGQDFSVKILTAQQANLNNCDILYGDGSFAMQYSPQYENFLFYIPNLNGAFYFNLSNGNRADIHCKTLHQSSDRKMKENVKVYKPNASKIQAVTFDFKEKYGGSKGHVGYIAQDVEKEFPQYVSVDDKDKRSLDYTGIHTAKIACLEAENVTFKKEISDLKGEIKELKALTTKMIEK